MLTLGIDPGTAIMGYGLVEGGVSASGDVDRDDLTLIEYGVFRTPANAPLSERLPLLYNGISELIKEYKPTAMSIEQLFFNKNVRTALSVGHARGVAILAAAHSSLTVSEYTPLQIKQAVVGYGRATKEQVQSMVKILLHMDHIPQPDDAADALAVAICHINSHVYQERISR